MKREFILLLQSVHYTRERSPTAHQNKQPKHLVYVWSFDDSQIKHCLPRITSVSEIVVAFDDFSREGGELFH